MFGKIYFHLQNNIIRNKVKSIEKTILNNNEIENKKIEKIITLIETLPYEKRKFDLNILYAKMILLKHDEHSLDDAWWALTNIEGRDNFEWNYLLSKITFEKGIYDEAKNYFNAAMKINGNDKRIKELAIKYSKLL